jgi:hypothetical protein
MYLIEFSCTDANDKKFNGHIKSKSRKHKQWVFKSVLQNAKPPFKKYSEKATLLK